jgi:hypothetical protein
MSQLANKLSTNLLLAHLVDKLLEQHCHNLLKRQLKVVGTELSQIAKKHATNQL